MARRSVAEIVTGAVVILAAAGFLGYAVAHSGIAPAGGYRLHAQFNSVSGLPVGSDVRLAGVKVGQVVAEAINPETYLVDVTFTVAKDIRLPKDTSASVLSEGLLGADYLALAPGGDAAMLPPNGRIMATQSPINLETMLGKFIFSMSGGGQAPAKGSGTAPSTNASKP